MPLSLRRVHRARRSGCCEGFGRWPRLRHPRRLEPWTAASAGASPDARLGEGKRRREEDSREVGVVGVPRRVLDAQREEETRCWRCCDRGGLRLQLAAVTPAPGQDTPGQDSTRDKGAVEPEAGSRSCRPCRPCRHSRQPATCGQRIGLPAATPGLGHAWAVPLRRGVTSAG